MTESDHHAGDRPPRATPLTYRDAGVDVAAGNRFVERIRAAVEATRRTEVLGGLGGFGGICALPAGMRDPVLVAGTDGVGTKLHLGIEQDRLRELGIDLVAMCVNDIATTGADPLFFLDYYASAHLDVEHAARVVEGIAAGCQTAGAALIGGETAEMPGMYPPGLFDLAGFCVGVAERSALLGPPRVTAGDSLVALASSGPHANGFSLIRRIRDADPGAAALWVDALLAPTRIYVPALQALRARVPIHALAHITGGGLTENLPRSLPAHLAAEVDQGSWAWPPVFAWLAGQGPVSHEEMLRTFNCGIGMVAVVPQASTEAAIAALTEAGEWAWRLGRVVAADGADRIRYV